MYNLMQSRDESPRSRPISKEVGFTADIDTVVPTGTGVVVFIPLNPISVTVAPVFVTLKVP
ncbi:hypothetical protein V7087_18540 [Neobacillus niacini]|uniref:hypothetical protein n=1 Tax=Neobacillus niacini TaxID=86668 RepID=UPI0030000BEF